MSRVVPPSSLVGGVIHHHMEKARKLFFVWKSFRNYFFWREFCAPSRRISLIHSISIYRVAAGAHSGARCKGEERHGGKGSFPVVGKLPTEDTLFCEACLQAWVSAGQVFAFLPVARR